MGFWGGFEGFDALGESVAEKGFARAEFGVGVEGPGEVGGQNRPGFDGEGEVGVGIGEGGVGV